MRTACAGIALEGGPRFFMGRGCGICRGRPALPARSGFVCGALPGGFRSAGCGLLFGVRFRRRNGCAEARSAVSAVNGCGFPPQRQLPGCGYFLPAARSDTRTIASGSSHFPKVLLRTIEYLSKFYYIRKKKQTTSIWQKSKERSWSIRSGAKGAGSAWRRGRERCTNRRPR